MPERTCIACRKKGEAVQFFRMVADPEGTLFVELDSRLPGRGAYCCLSRQCVEKILNQKKLGHAFRTKVQVPEPEALLSQLESLLKRKLEGLLGAAWRKKAVAAGRDAAARAARSENSGTLFWALDLSEGSRSEVEGVSSFSPVALPFTMEELGRLFERRPVGVVFVGDRSIAESLEFRGAQARSLIAD